MRRGATSRAGWAARPVSLLLRSPLLVALLLVSLPGPALAQGSEPLDGVLPQDLPGLAAPLASALGALTTRFRTLLVTSRGISIKIAIDTARLPLKAVRE